MFIKKKVINYKKYIYILIILVDFYASLSRYFFLEPGSGSTFPEVDPDPDK